MSESNRNRALDLAADLFKCGDIGADEIVKYAGEFYKFLDEPDTAVSKQGWDYFVDEENQYSDSAYFRRIKGNDTSTSEFLGGTLPALWRFGDNVGRDYMAQAGYREIRFEELPDWVKEIS